MEQAATLRWRTGARPGWMLCIVMLMMPLSMGALTVEPALLFQYRALGVILPGEGGSTAGPVFSLQTSSRAEAGPLRANLDLKVQLAGGWGATALWQELGSDAGLSLSVPAYDASLPPPSTLLIATCNQAAVSLSGFGLRFEAGILPLRWGTAQAFRPADPFDDTMTVPGLAARRSHTACSLSWFPGTSSRLEAVYAWRQAERRIAGIRYTAAPGTVSMGISSSWHHDASSGDAMQIAGEIIGELGSLMPYLEVAARTGPLFSDTTFSWTRMRFEATAGIRGKIGPVSGVVEGWLLQQGAQHAARAFGSLSWSVSDFTTFTLPLLWLGDLEMVQGWLVCTMRGIAGGTLELSVGATAVLHQREIWQASLSWTTALW